MRMDFRSLPNPPPDLRHDRSFHLSIAQQLFRHGLRKNVDQLVHGLCATLFGFVIARSLCNVRSYNSSAYFC